MQHQERTCDLANKHQSIYPEYPQLHVCTRLLPSLQDKQLLQTHTQTHLKLLGPQYIWRVPKAFLDWSRNEGRERIKSIKASLSQATSLPQPLCSRTKIYFIWQCEYMCDQHECWGFKTQPEIPGPFQLCFYFIGPLGDCWEQVWSSSLLTS